MDKGVGEVVSLDGTSHEAAVVAMRETLVKQKDTIIRYQIAVGVMSGELDRMRLELIDANVLIDGFRA